jgi:hypothetical protein
MPVEHKTHSLKQRLVRFEAHTSTEQQNAHKTLRLRSCFRAHGPVLPRSRTTVRTLWGQHHRLLSQINRFTDTEDLAMV